MEGILKFVLCLVVASGMLSAQFGDCTPLVLSSGCTYNTPSLVIHAVVSPHLGIAGNCPEGPCVVKYRVDLDVWASPAASPNITPELCFGKLPSSPPSANCWPTTIPAVPGPPNTFGLHADLDASLKCGDWVDVEMNFHLFGPLPGMYALLNIFRLHAECRSCAD